MKSALFICNTYYQLLVSVQLKLTLFSESSVDLWLSDHSEQAGYVVKKLNQLAMFHKVNYRPTKAWVIKQRNRTVKERIRSLVQPAFDLEERQEVKPYDEIVFFNITDDVYRVSNEARLKGGEGKLSRMEEGLVSCNSSHSHYLNRGNIIREYARTILRKPTILNKETPFYCFIPELCDSNFPMKPFRIPSISETKDELTTAMKRIFGDLRFSCKEKYIYFASSSDIDNASFGETELVLQIAEIIGVNNLAVKMHPRDGRDVYRKAGLTVVENSFVPWEVFQLCNDFSDRVFLSATSGSFLAMSAMLGNQPPSLYLKPAGMNELQMRRWNKAFGWAGATVQKLHGLGLCENVCSLTIDEFEKKVADKKVGRACRS